MAVDLTPEDRATVEGNRKSPRPQYFSAAQSEQQQISEDFEAFIILQDKAVIEETLQWLGQAGGLMETRVDRNGVTLEAVAADIDDRSTRQSEVDDIVQGFTDWKAAFQAGNFSDVSEVGLIIADAQATAEELFVFQERMKHLEQMHQRITERLRQSVSSAQLNQLLSWPTPLLAY